MELYKKVSKKRRFINKDYSTKQMYLYLLFISTILLIALSPYYYFLSTSLKLRIGSIFLISLFFLFPPLSKRLLQELQKLNRFYKIMDMRYFAPLFIIFAFFFLYALVVDKPSGDFHGFNFGNNLMIPTDEAHDIEFLSIGVPNIVHYVITKHHLKIWGGHDLNIQIAPGHVIILLNSLFGAIGLFYLLKISREFFSPHGPIFFLIFIFSGFVEMFFGYWEIYTQGVMFTVLFIYYCFKSVSEPKAKFYAAIFLSLAIASHSTIVTLYAGFFFFLLLSAKGTLKEKIKNVFRYSAITFGLYLLLISLFYLGGMMSSLVAIYSTHATSLNTIFSFKHYLGIFNQHLITGGISFVAVILFFICYKFKNKDPLTYSFFASAIAYLIFMIIYVHSFGYFGVWPLMTSGGVLMVMFISWLAKTYLSEKDFTRILPLLLFASIFFYLTTAIYDRSYICSLVC